MKKIYGFLLVLAITVLLAACISAFVMGINTDFDTDFNIEYFNTSESLYVEAVPIERLEKTWCTEFYINDEMIYVNTVYIIKDHEIQKIYNGTKTVVYYNDNVLIGEKDSYQTTEPFYIIFVHENVKNELYT